MNESQLLSAQMRRKVTQNKWNSQIFTQIFSFLDSWDSRAKKNGRSKKTSRNRIVCKMRNP